MRLFYYGDYLLPEVPVVEGFPNYGIRRDEANDRYDVFYTASGFYYDGSAVRATNGVNCPRYTLPLDGSGEWTYFDTAYSGWTHSATRVVFFSSVVVTNGAGSTNIWIAAGYPVAPYDKKYLIRSGSTLYTITDSTLTALDTTELTAEIFRTYGVDDLPDGSLLVGLTNPEILYWHDSTDDLPVLTAAVTGLPPTPQVVVTDVQDMSDPSILGIESVTVTASEDVLFAMSFDDGATWKAYNGSQWVTLDTENAGMTAETFQNISLEAWAEVVTSTAYRLRFVLMSAASYVTSVVINYLN